MANKWWSKNIDKDLSEIVIRLKCTLSGKVIDRDWTEDVDLDYDNLDEDMETISSILAFWSAVLAEARKLKAMKEMQLDIRRSKILSSLKEMLKEGVKMTVKDKEDLVNVDKEYSILKAQEIELDATVSKLFGIVESLRVKADMVRSMAAMKRAELHNS